MWADVILPEATYLERYDDLVAVAHKTPFIELRVPAHEPLFDTRPGWWIARELGLRLGLEQYFPWKGIEEYLDTRLQSIGLDLETLKGMGTLVQKGKPWLTDWEKEGRLPFGTPSGKIELYCQAFKQAGHQPLPVYTPPEPPPQASTASSTAVAPCTPSPVPRTTGPHGDGPGKRGLGPHRGSP